MATSTSLNYTNPQGASSTSSANPIIGPTGGVWDIIRSIATGLGVDPNLAVATAQVESGGNAKAVGDSGCSYGLFQLNTCGGEGTGLNQTQLFDPVTNTTVALTRFAQLIKSGFTGSPGQLAAAAQRPADPTGYASKVNALLGTGDGPVTLGGGGGIGTGSGAGTFQGPGSIDLGPLGKHSLAPLYKIGLVLAGVGLIIGGLMLYVQGHRSFQAAEAHA